MPSGFKVLEFFQTLSWAAVFQIILIDILLGGDNAVVIALACRNLEPKQRMQGILGHRGRHHPACRADRFALTLLAVPFLKVVGGLLLVWIGVKLLVPEDDEHGNIKGGTSIVAAVKTIIIADFVMSLDNVIAIAGAAQNAHADHQIGLVVFGLIVSVPIIIWGSTLVLAHRPLSAGRHLRRRAAGLDRRRHADHGRVCRESGEQPTAVKIAAEIIGALVGLGRWLASRKTASKESAHESA